jgi:hypothetical protein
MILALLFPVVLAGGVPDLWVALPLVVVQVAAMLLGWTGLLRAAQGRLGLAGIGADALRVLASGLLNSLFLALVIIVLAIVLLGIAGATGLAPGDDLTMAAQVLLTVEIAAALLILTLAARLLVAGPATVAQNRVISLAALGWTRGSGLRPAAGLVAVLLPYMLLALSVLMMSSASIWVDVVWALVLGFIQAPLLAGYATGLWRTSLAPKGPS